MDKHFMFDIRTKGQDQRREEVNFGKDQLRSLSVEICYLWTDTPWWPDLLVQSYPLSSDLCFFVVPSWQKWVWHWSYFCNIFINLMLCVYHNLKKRQLIRSKTCCVKTDTPWWPDLLKTAQLPSYMAQDLISKKNYQHYNYIKLT